LFLTPAPMAIFKELLRLMVTPPWCCSHGLLITIEDLPLLSIISSNLERNALEFSIKIGLKRHVGGGRRHNYIFSIVIYAGLVKLRAFRAYYCGLWCLRLAFEC
jgi:hypothetical protein